MRSDTFDFSIPEPLIAQFPARSRDGSRLMVVSRSGGEIVHSEFRDLHRHLQRNDLLVLNDTLVEPCRLHCKRQGSGGHVEVFLLKQTGPVEYEALTGSWKNLKPGQVVELPGSDVTATLTEKDAGGAKGRWQVVFEGAPEVVGEAIRSAARMPLPPYIKRERDYDPFVELDQRRYQTVYAKTPGAVAAPTAGLHFSEQGFARLDREGIATTHLTLHVGPGTFMPLKVDSIDEHEMHAETYTVPETAVAAIERATAAGGRVIAVGTTSCRTLETVADDAGRVREGSGETRLFIYPPYEFKCVDGLLTNFHLPRSTLIFLVAAYLGVELTRRAYLEAIEREYRFFSYGDAMLCLP